MILSIEHVMLLSGPDRETSEHLVRRFFRKSQLVHYDSITFGQPATINGMDPEFTERLQNGVAENRRKLGEFLEKLQQEGCTSLDDLLYLEQGFRSKLLHTMSHLLDGFFGIDSHFFDIDEISHWITESRQKQIEQSADQCWLVHVTAQSVYGQGFENKSD